MFARISAFIKRFWRISKHTALVLAIDTFYILAGYCRYFQSEKLFMFLVRRMDRIDIILLRKSYYRTPTLYAAVRYYDVLSNTPYYTRHEKDTYLIADYESCEDRHSQIAFCILTKIPISARNRIWRCGITRDRHNNPV